MDDDQPTRDSPVLQPPAPPGDDPERGLTIGRYRIVRKLGEGGFGAVFEAEQVQPVRRRVALKVIKLGMDTREVIRRFDAERQALTLMEHPHIARVLDAGATESGRPYFVMELVAGEPITHYCDEHRLPVPERLELFAQVCGAVQHAHTRGVIHRDLKPSNVLVGAQDGRPAAKVIDFGIAKATGGGLNDATLTALSQMIGTPLYMSPEQAEGRADIDTRTDVYSLGVLLYELLTGTTPFTPETLRSAALGEVQRILREVDPPGPSARLSGSTATLPAVAASRGVEPARLARMLRGELDWIVMKALEKDRERRYDSPNGLALDVQRYLRGEPVGAAPPSRAYRLRKFVARHKGTVTAGAAVAAALVAGVIAFAWQARIARARAAESEVVSRFQADMLEQVDPAQAGQMLSADVKARYAAALAAAGLPETERRARIAVFGTEWQRVNATDTARDLIDRTILRPAVQAIDTQFKEQPLIDATLRQALANRCRTMALFDAALPLQERALATRRRLLGDADLHTLESCGEFGTLLQDMGRLSDAEPLLREALDGLRRALGPRHPDTLAMVNNLGSLLQVQARLDEAGRYYREAYDGRRRVLGADHPETLVSMNNVGYLLAEQGRFDEAAAIWRETLGARRRVLGNEHPDTLESVMNLASLLQLQDRYADAEPLAREAYDGYRRVRGTAHPDTLIALANLASLLDRQGKQAEAEPLLREVLLQNRRVLGPEHTNTVSAMINLAGFLQDRGRPAEAEALYVEATATLRRTLGETAPLTLIATGNLGSARNEQRRFADALATLEPIESAARTAFTGDNAVRLGAILLSLGQARTGLGRFAAAEPALLEAHRILLAAHGAAHPDTRSAEAALARLHEARGQAGEGARTHPGSPLD